MIVASSGPANREANGLTGTAVLTRFIVRRDRVRIVVWIASITATVAVTAVSVKGLYPTQAALDLAAAAANGNAAAIAFNGPAQGLETVGGEIAFQAGSFGLVLAALMSLLMIGRLTRGEEEAGRVELVRSLPVGRSAPTVAAALAVVAMNLVVGALVALTLIAQHLPVAGSIAFGLSFTMIGLVFACVAVVVAQVTENTRVVYGVAGALLGAAFVLRAVGDIGDGTISWLSPIGGISAPVWCNRDPADVVRRRASGTRSGSQFACNVEAWSAGAPECCSRRLRTARSPTASTISCATTRLSPTCLPAPVPPA